MSEQYAVKVEKLIFKLGKKTLINDVSFKLKQRKKIALVGLNGAGKSTLIRLLLGLDKATEGTVVYPGYSSGNSALYRVLGYQAPDMSALSTLSVKEYLLFCCQLKALSYESALECVLQECKRWRLESIFQQPLTSLSQGNLQKVSIAQAFLNKPDFIFLDEPSQTLDPLEQEYLVENLKQLSSYKLCLFSSHDINEAVTIADEVLFIHRGQVIAQIVMNDSQQHWLVAEPDTFLHQVDDEVIAPQLIFQGTKKNLYLIESEKEKITLQFVQNLKKTNSEIMHFQSGKNILMPLFKLIAQGEL